MSAKQISQAIHVLQHGGVIAYSTDTILGLGCDPNNETAIKKLLWLKNRSAEKGLILLCADTDTVQTYSLSLSNEQLSKITEQSNQPTTWLIPAKADVLRWITGQHDSLAIRLTQHPDVRNICASMGAIVSSSANISDYPTALNEQQLRDWFGPHLDYAIIGSNGTGIPSRICDLQTGKVLRN